PALPLKEILRLPVEQWKGRMKNDFEEGVFKHYPLIKAVKEQLYVKGAVYAAMSGSGSAVFGIFPKNKIAGIVFETGYQVFSIN
ncbi:MAG TPA: 4-(cytidine 5'-diphospho)-2-C-methyl-D-erythritol kinase, partial [Chitinophagaceae bacterium]